VAVHAVLVHAATEIMPTTWVTFFDALALYFLVRAERSAGWAWPLASGVALGISALFLPTILLFVPVALIALWMSRPGRARATAAGAALLGVALMVLPVTVRNYAAGGEVVLVSANDGINFYIGNNADYDRTVAFRPGKDYRLLDWEPMEQGYRTASERSAYFYRKALRFVRTEPLRAAGLGLHKLYLFFDGPEIPRSSDLYLARGLSRILALTVWHAGLYFPDGLVMPLALVGIAACWRERRRLLLVLGFAATQVAGVCAFFVSARYRAPSLPVWSLFAVVGVTWLAGRVHRGSVRERLGLVVILVALVAVLNLPTRESGLDLRQEELFYRGQASLDVGNFEAARGYLESLLASLPSDCEAWNLLGDTRAGLRDNTGALEAWRRSTSCDPAFADPWRNIARTMARQGDLDGAIQTLQSSLSHMGDLHNHGNDYGVDLVMLASFWSQKGDLERALRAVEQALQLDPTNAKAQRWKTQLLSRLGRSGAPPRADAPPRTR
jgi:Flp pilus assembly protein TadD